MQYLLLSKDPYIGQKKEEKNVIKTNFTGHGKNVRTRRNILILGMLLCFSNSSKIFNIEVQQTKATFEKRHMRRITKWNEMWRFSMSGVLHFEGWEESSGSVCHVLGKQVFLPLKSQFLWC